MHIHKVNLAFPRVPYLQFQPIADQKGKKKKKKNFGKFQKAKLEFSVTSNCLHSIDIMLSIKSNLEMT